MLSAPLPVSANLGRFALVPQQVTPSVRLATGKLPFTTRNIQALHRASNSKMPNFGLNARFAAPCCRKVTKEASPAIPSRAWEAVNGLIILPNRSARAARKQPKNSVKPYSWPRYGYSNGEACLNQKVSVYSRPSGAAQSRRPMLITRHINMLRRHLSIETVSAESRQIANLAGEVRWGSAKLTSDGSCKAPPRALRHNRGRS